MLDLQRPAGDLHSPAEALKYRGAHPNLSVLRESGTSDHQILMIYKPLQRIKPLLRTVGFFSPFACSHPSAPQPTLGIGNPSSSWGPAPPHPQALWELQ